MFIFNLRLIRLEFLGVRNQTLVFFKNILRSFNVYLGLIVVGLDVGMDKMKEGKMVVYFYR